MTNAQEELASQYKKVEEKNLQTVTMETEMGGDSDDVLEDGSYPFMKHFEEDKECDWDTWKKKL